MSKLKLTFKMALVSCLNTNQKLNFVCWKPQTLLEKIRILKVNMPFRAGVDIAKIRVLNCKAHEVHVKWSFCVIHGFNKPRHKRCCFDLVTRALNVSSCIIPSPFRVEISISRYIDFIN